MMVNHRNPHPVRTLKTGDGNLETQPVDFWSRRVESNHRPAVYETAALPTELRRLLAWRPVLGFWIEKRHLTQAASVLSMRQRKRIGPTGSIIPTVAATPQLQWTRL
jgi:hypothetical protein